MKENLMIFLSSIKRLPQKLNSFGFTVSYVNVFFDENFSLQNCQKLKKWFLTVKLISQLIFDLHESNIPQMKKKFLWFLASFLSKSQKLKNWNHLAPNVFRYKDQGEENPSLGLRARGLYHNNNRMAHLPVLHIWLVPTKTNKQTSSKCVSHFQWNNL